mmetsp:Transcript_8953/g.19349  ORF Transcript_8953/g.19349 Transcript_8953/m.19349 type:complete len:82 (+) Transcript_8953:223-468(+)
MNNRSSTGSSSRRGLLGFLPRGGPAIVMGVTSLAALGAVFYSHDSQVRDRETMKAGVERDKERIRQKRKAAKQQQREQELQ